MAYSKERNAVRSSGGHCLVAQRQRGKLRVNDLAHPMPLKARASLYQRKLQILRTRAPCPSSSSSGTVHSRLWFASATNGRAKTRNYAHSEHPAVFHHVL